MKKPKSFKNDPFIKLFYSFLKNHDLRSKAYQKLSGLHLVKKGVAKKVSHTQFPSSP